MVLEVSMRRWLPFGSVAALGLASVAALCVACGSGSGQGSGGAGGTGSTGTADGGATPASSSTDGVGGNPFASVGPSTSTGPTCSEGKQDEDGDKDGFTEDQGDCNDCDPGVNPKAIEVIAEAGGEPVDEDCNGTADDVPLPCDDGLALDSREPSDAAKALGLCKFVVSSKWVLADGSPPPADEPPVLPSDPKKAADVPAALKVSKLDNFHLGHGLLSDFGDDNAPREGKRMLALSSGAARGVGEPGFIHRNAWKGYQSEPPAGFEGTTPACGTNSKEAPFDATGLEVELEVPSNAQGFSFDFNFFTYEWPQFICEEFNDFFVAILSPAPEGQKAGNISFDGQGNPISVNNAFIDSCGCTGNPPGTCSAGGKAFKCALGKTGLAGTDFELNTDKNGAPIDHNGAPDTGSPKKGYTNGSTGWLSTSVGVTPGEIIKIRFVSYDSADGNVDSLALIDNWKWSAKPGSKKPTTVPVPK